MKICISSTGPNLDAQVDLRFGRCPYFLFVNSEDSKLLETVPNQSVQMMQGAGITAAQLVVNKKAKIVITGNVGPNAYNVLTMSGVKIYTGVFDVSAEQALIEFQKGNLKELSAAPMPQGFGRGPGGGFGQGPRGGGFGRGPRAGGGRRNF